MERIVEIGVKITKITVFALLTVQCVYAVIWLSGNFMKVPDFSLPSESLIYSQLVGILGHGFFFLYILQGMALFSSIQVVFGKSLWIPLFTITNPLVLQFVCAPTPDVFAVSILLLLLASLIKKEPIKSIQTVWIFALGLLSAPYFFAGLICLFLLQIQLYIVQKKECQNENRRKWTKSFLWIQFLLVSFMIVVFYLIQANSLGGNSVFAGTNMRFTVNPDIPSNHSILSVIKGTIVDFGYWVMTPFTSIYAMDHLLLTFNGWNYSNFTEELPRIGRAYMELSERNLCITGVLTVLVYILQMLSARNIKKKIKKLIVPIIAVLFIAFEFTVLSKRGIDYRSGLFMIPLWYGIILFGYHKVKIFCKKEETKELC